MRPTWKAATIVDPSANVSGSTLAWWLVVALALHVAWVNGSVSIVVGPVTADAPPAGARTPATTAATATPESPALLLARRVELLMVPPGGRGASWRRHAQRSIVRRVELHVSHSDDRWTGAARSRTASGWDPREVRTATDGAGAGGAHCVVRADHVRRVVRVLQRVTRFVTRTPGPSSRPEQFQDDRLTSKSQVEGPGSLRRASS